MKTVTIKELHAKTGSHVRRAARTPLRVTDRGQPVAIITGVKVPQLETFQRIRALRARLTLAKGETAQALISEGRRL